MFFLYVSSCLQKKNSQESSCSHTWFQFCGGKKRREEIVFCSECCDGDLCNNKGCGSDGMWLFQPISPQPCLTDHYSIFKHVHTCLSESLSNPWTKQFWATTVKCLAQINNWSIWWSSNLRLTDIYRLRANHCETCIIYIHLDHSKVNMALNSIDKLPLFWRG